MLRSPVTLSHSGSSYFSLFRLRQNNVTFKYLITQTQYYSTAVYQKQAFNKLLRLTLLKQAAKTLGIKHDGECLTFFAKQMEGN